MSSTHAVDLNDAKNHLPELVDQVSGGEEVVLTREGQPVARLVPVRTRRPRRQFGSAKGLITVGPEFDAPLD